MIISPGILPVHGGRTHFTAARRHPGGVAKTMLARAKTARTKIDLIESIFGRFFDEAIECFFKVGFKANM